jgi:Na+-translocating ferredoxin:NAD+ oxidoreductase subunit E
MASVAREFTKGLWEMIPPFRLVLGLCPVLAVTTKAFNGLGMGLATTFVLLCSNVLVSAMRSFIPRKVRIAVFIVVVATFVVITELVMKAYFFGLSQVLGIFIPLIVVNCIILGRAEAFASKNNVILSAADGLGIGLGFTMALTFLGGIREVFGYGTLLDCEYLPGGIVIFGESFKPFSAMVAPAGAFVCLGLILGAMNLFNNWQAVRASRKGA